VDGSSFAVCPPLEPQREQKVYGHRAYNTFSLNPAEKDCSTLYTNAIQEIIRDSADSFGSDCDWASALTKNANMSSVARWSLRAFGRSPEKGASTGVYLASSPEVEGVTGMYFANCRERKSSKVSYDENVARRLWGVSEKVTDLASESE